MNAMRYYFDQLLSNPLIERLLYIAIGITIVAFISYYLKRLLNRSIKDNASKYRARKAMNLMSYLLMVIIVLLVYSDKLGSIGVALGVAGAGVAFALQEVIVSFAGWLNIMITGRVNVGERVMIGGVKGDIIDIGVFSSTIMEMGVWIDGDLYNGRIVSISNSFVFKEDIHHYSAEYPFLWDEVRIPIRHDSDVAVARQIFFNVLNEVCGEYAEQSKAHWSKMTMKFRVEEAKVDPMVSMVFDENWITFTLRYVVDFKKRRTIKDLIFTRIHEEMEKTEGKIHVASTAMEVSMKRE